MRRTATLVLAGALIALTGSTGTTQSPANPYARDAKQPIDEAYTKKLKEYTTEPFFTSPLVDYLPASKTVPTPQAVLGDIAGAPGKLPYSHEVYQYMRMVEKASPRVKVYSIGKTEEGREMIAVAVSSEANLAKLDENRARLAKLADPRTISLNDAEADKLVDQSVPVYYITGAIHSPETGSPTALMELVYRLAVDESPYIQKIRSRIVTLITPIVEVDGRDRQVDIYRWHLANPDKHWPSLIYWGKYVAHDNNRDAMALTLNLTRNVLNTYIEWKAQVLHDLHESVAYLYDNTVGDGPYNAWLDPILTDEWQMIGWHNVSEMTKMGMPGVFTHGTFDTWTPGYLMFIAATHNGISRLYETFGNGGADTLERTLGPNDTARTWYKQNPPLPKAKWSQRNNNNYQQTGLLVSLNHFADNKNLFLKNFYLKSKRSILKPKTEGPAAYVFPGDDPRPGPQADLLRILQLQGCEVSRATAPFTVTLPGKKRPAARDDQRRGVGNGDGDGDGPNAQDKAEIAATDKPSQPETRTFPAGTYVLRMDQPYSRIADTLLDYQVLGARRPAAESVRRHGLDVRRALQRQGRARHRRRRCSTRRSSPSRATLTAAGQRQRHGQPLCRSTTTPTRRSRRCGTASRTRSSTSPRSRSRPAARSSTAARSSFAAASAPPISARRSPSSGSRPSALSAAPSVKTHPAKAARIALMHTWINTQDEGWWRLALDQLAVPFTYISTQDVAAGRRPRIQVRRHPLSAGRARAGQQIVTGLPMYGNPLPWKTTELTPNIGKIDSTDDMRPGLGWQGLANLQKFVRDGGVLITVDDTANFAIQFGFDRRRSVTPAQRLKITGAVLRSKVVDGASPIAYGYDDNLSIYSSDGPIFGVSNTLGGRGGRGGGAEPRRATGRGTPDEPDQPQGRPPSDPLPQDPKVEPWQAAPIREEQLRNGISIIPPAQRPRVVFRYGDARDLLVSGLLDGGTEIAQRPMVIDVPVDKGHVVLFSNNPIWRGETHGSYFLVLNAILNHDNLNAGRKLDTR